MNHEDAKKSMATERYILDEMEPAERDAFEEHFFECSICSDDVRDAAKFAAGVRTSEGRLPVPVPVPLPAPRRFNWLALAASLLVVGISYESFWMILHMRAAQAQVASASLGEVITLESASRGANEQVVKVVHADEAVALTFPIETDEPRPFYICEVRDATGKTRASLSVPQAKASEPVLMVLAPHTLPSGPYKLVIRGGDREIAAYPFTVEVR
jgi:hypothetical protein